MNLFTSQNDDKSVYLNIQDGTISYYPHFISENESNEIFKALVSEINWQQDHIKIFGKTHPQPRLTALYGEESYSYSGIVMNPYPFTPLLLKLKNKIEEEIDASFNTVLLNLYRNGQDSNGWHSDDEKELGTNPVIASLSFGAERFFKLRHKINKDLKHRILLEAGSLLVMEDETQHYWQHQVAKSKKIVDPRINLTFRRIF